jgi:hypothetical protein
MQGIAQIAVTADRKAKKGIYPRNDDVLTEALKTENYYQRVMWQAVRDMYRGSITSFEFESVMIQLIEGQLRRAWNAGMREIGLDPAKDMTDEYRAELESIMLKEFDFVPRLTMDISEAIRLQTPVDPFKARVDLWASRYNDVVNQAKLFCGKGNQTYMWVYGDTDHCETCSKLNGLVATADEWNQSGFKPQSPPNDFLECGGWNCGCKLELTSKRRSPDALTTLMNIAMSKAVILDDSFANKALEDAVKYLDDNFQPTTKEKSNLAKVIPDDGSRPYFIHVKKEEESPPETGDQSKEA